MFPGYSLLVIVETLPTTLGKLGPYPSSSNTQGERRNSSPSGTLKKIAPDKEQCPGIILTP
jgi:hypothetical protein